MLTMQGGHIDVNNVGWPQMLTMHGGHGDVNNVGWPQRW